MTPGEKIDALRLRLAARNDSRWSDERIEYLAATNLDGRFHLSFFGDPFGDSYRDLLATLRDPEIAECIRSLVLAGPDVGSNGTKNWDIEPLLGGSTLFSAMETFTIQLHQPGHHNHPVVASTYDENGAIAKLLERSPQLRHLPHQWFATSAGTIYTNPGDQPTRLRHADGSHRRRLHRMPYR